ncbi:acetyl-CoA acetyltransferase [Nocardia sp. 852002-20019_SCH5090214]|uniref:Acetyl-CoA C-acyltransferase n=1 Tax=Nocardia nova TaxID=37330 RepID=A0A2S6AEN6_9NOCA|nr:MULTISPECIES: thiolase family protein [Nocardia]OBF68306.1 acetyl-CoA acetyltransferase [Mycobacterium sp. 852002-51759_SCH5129042]MBF6272736.1 thiolase family protein [Nocardia nova]OBA44955.1 acetyl-CoA acetyltransferase [Nocardia sp. 852002-51101_SCH5132738]OBA47104.1 acetyl-CoA acetyltransferase [Nocardia sp. 852002-20019_SCH5090214]OBB41537.1 acetyl-CoA acetyltransferase [Nocardia sp. 852002-51244_SCH5132740]
MRDAVIVEAVRTPIGKGKATGALHELHPVDLFAHSLREVVRRSGIDPVLIDDVIGGVVTQVGEQSVNITRRAALAAGYPESVPATTVDRQCGSSQQAIHFAAQGVLAGAYDIVVAGGLESMSRVPMGSSVAGATDINGVAFTERYPDELVPQGISAELIAARWGISRIAMDEFSLASHEKAATATKNGSFEAQLAPLAGLSTDEGIRVGSTLETLAGLRPAYYSEAYAARFPEIGWNVTAANASQINDGSAAVLIMTSEKAAQLGLRPLARLHSFAVAGDDPLLMLTAVIPATRKVLQRSGLSLADIDLFEVNEAFASVVLAWAADTGADLSRVNVNGGAIALGHPLGASGARLATTLVHALHERGARFGLQTMCEAGGLANATIYERL